MEHVYKRILKNGLNVVFIPHKVDSTTICLRGLAGSNYESKKDIGVAHFLEHYLLYNSRKKQKVLNLGGILTGTTSRDDVAFISKTLNNDYVSSLELLNELLNMLDFTDTSIQRIKSIISHEIMQNKENSKMQIGRIAYKLLYPKSRFATYNTGDIENIENLSLFDLENFYRNLYVPNRFVLSICGNYEPKEIFDSVESMFTCQSKNYSEHKLQHKKEIGFKYQIIERQENYNTHLRIDFHGVTNKGNCAYTHHLLSLLVKHRLQEYLDKYAITQPYSLDTASFSSHSYGIFGMYTAIGNTHVEEVANAFLFCIRDIAKGNITSSELAYFKRKTNTNLTFSLEKTSLRADFYAELYLSTSKLKNHIEVIEYINSIKIEDVIKAAKYYSEQQPKITVITPAPNLVENQINKVFAINHLQL